MVEKEQNIQLSNFPESSPFRLPCFKYAEMSSRAALTGQNEDNILDQIYKNKYVRIIIMMILILYNIYENAY